MHQWSGSDVSAEFDRLERESAELLGRILFAFARVELTLGLLLVWANEGRDIPKLTTLVQKLSFGRKLALLRTLAFRKYAPSSEGRVSYRAWLKEALGLCVIRNSFVHGRWGVNPVEGSVFCTKGLPTSPTQRDVPYTLAELRSILQALPILSSRLNQLRSSWPV